MKGTSGYVWDPTIGLELLFVAQISATEGEDVKEVIWYVLRVFLFAIVFVCRQHQLNQILPIKVQSRLLIC